MEQETITNSNEDWAKEYEGDNPTQNNKYFSDKLVDDEVSFTAEIIFKNEGEKETIKTPWGERKVITFKIEHEQKEKIMQVGETQFDYLKAIANAKPLTGKKAKVTRVGTTQKDTKRTIKFL